MRLKLVESLLLATSIASVVGACADTERKKPTAAAAGDGGAPAEGGRDSEAAGAGRSSAGKAGESKGGVGGATPHENGGEAGASEPLGEGGEAGSGAEETCGAAIDRKLLGDYTEPNGDALWLRDSGKAVTVTRVPAGKPAAGKPPALWQVVAACPAQSALILKASTDGFTRLDYLAGSASLTACLSAASASSVDQASALVAADRTNTIDAGCNGGPWTRFVKGAP